MSVAPDSTERSPRSQTRLQRAVRLVILGVLPTVVAASMLDDRLARPLAHLMPSDSSEALGAAVLPLLVALATVAGEQRRARGAPYPPWLTGLICGFVLAMLVLAPPPGRGGTGSSVVHNTVPVFVTGTWVGYAALAAGWLATMQLRSAREERDFRRGRLDLALPPAPPYGRDAILLGLAVAYAVPVGVLVAVLAVG
ncbi:hypothetical protein ACI8AG_10020 [Blastococcus sp. SYSU DS0552]